MSVIFTTSAAVFECHSKACAPPPAGHGGSDSSGGAPAGRMRDVATHQLKRMGATESEIKSLLSHKAPDGLKQIARPFLRRQGFTPGEIRQLIGRDTGNG